MSDSPAPGLEGLVKEFNDELSQSLRAFARYCPPLKSTVVGVEKARESVSIRFDQHGDQPGALRLMSRGQTVLSLKVVFRFTWDSTSKHLAVQKSSFNFYPYRNVTGEPLFRVEYVRNPDGYRPSSHFHVHAHRDEFTHLLSFASKLDVEREEKVEE